MGATDWLTDHGEIVDAIRALEPGNTVRVRTEGVSYRNAALVVRPDSEHPTPLGECSIADDVRTGTRYEIDPLYRHQLEEGPWLRRDGKSAGRIGAIAVVEGGGDS